MSTVPSSIMAAPFSAELAHELKLKLVNGDEFAAILTEAEELFNVDAHVRACLGDAAGRLHPLLVELCKDPKVRNAKREVHEMPVVKHLAYVLTDVLPTLESSYLPAVIAGVEEAVATDNAPFRNIRNRLELLLAELLARGWMFESLHPWVILLARGDNGRPFPERWAFVTRYLLQGPQSFDAHLRLTGPPGLGGLGLFKDFTFAPAPPVVANPTPEVRKFLERFPQTTFAHARIEAVDFKSAAHAALEKFEHCLDRLRFDFSAARIRLEPRILIARAGDERGRLEQANFPVPNPIHALSLEEFRDEAARADSLFNRPGLQPSVRERYTSAMRHYRLGEDAESYRDKLLNWWMGLEFLTKLSDSAGGIGEIVSRRCRSVMFIRHAVLILHDLEGSVRAALERWPQEVRAVIGPVEDDARIRPEQFVRVLQDPTAQSVFAASLSRRPWLAARVGELATIFSDSQKTREFFEDHQRRLGWHLQRIYRARCSIVHGSPMQLRLMLLCANLEAYLREMLVVIARTLERNLQVRSLEEFYERAEFARERRYTILKDAKQTPPTDPLALFDGLVTSSNH